jgi:transposase
MSKALSVDLRARAVAAVRSGATHREAAERFGVSAASVSRWRALEREQGDVMPKPLGGDRKSARIDAHKAAIVEALGPEADRTIEEVRQALKERGLAFSFGSLQRFFKRHAITRKKRPRTPPNRTDPTS